MLPLEPSSDEVLIQNLQVDLSNYRMKLRRMQRKYKGVDDKIDALERLARGCSDHPSYRAQRRSKTDCPVCEELYALAQTYLYTD